MTKTIFSLLLAVLLALCLAPGALAEDLEYNIEGASDYFGEGGYLKNGVARRGYLQDFEWMSGALAGNQFFYPLRIRDFAWDRAGIKPELTPKNNEFLRISVDVRYNQGPEVFDTIALVNRGEEIGLLIDFVDFYPHLDSQEFEVECAFTQGGGEIPGADFLIAGVMRNRGRYVYSAATRVELGVGRQATGYDDVKGIAFDLGCGVTLTGNLLCGQEVYAHADDRPNWYDRELMAEHPGIQRVIRLETIDLAGRVRIDTGEELFYVYDGNLACLGTTGDTLPFERLYYLSPTKF